MSATAVSANHRFPYPARFILGNEAAERFSYYGMKGILALYITSVLLKEQDYATHVIHLFGFVNYFMPLLGAWVSDKFWGRYKTILWISLFYCGGHGVLAMSDLFTGIEAKVWCLFIGLGLIAFGSGGIKPCVSAHVGDQFGAANAHLLSKVFNWFYFSINVGAFVSMLLTPWLLEWHGPHWAFGVPGGLMALATLVFWSGRNRFIHVPPGGMRFLRELTSREGLVTIAKLLPLYAFIAVFWALFDQTGSTWIFQSQDMDRRFLGFEWLPSQIQSLNSVFVLLFIPLFSYGLYPLIDRVWTLTPMRKIGIGLFLMVGSFALVALIQQWIDGGARPSVRWQILAFAILTASEVMVSIVALEFAYTQAPRTMKSLLMCFYLCAVAMGNFLVAGVNHLIQVPSAVDEQLESAIALLPSAWKNSPRNVVLPGFDAKSGTEDDLVVRLEHGLRKSVEFPSSPDLQRMLEILKRGSVDSFPEPEVLRSSLGGSFGRDYWGNEIRYERLNSRTVRLISDGPDGKSNTPWDTGFLLTLPEPVPVAKTSWTDRLRPASPWLERRKQELGITNEHGSTKAAEAIAFTPFIGGQTKLHGAAYFWFFTKLMLGTALAFVPYALIYRGRSYLQG